MKRITNRHIEFCKWLIEEDDRENSPLHDVVFNSGYDYKSKYWITLNNGKSETLWGLVRKISLGSIKEIEEQEADMYNMFINQFRHIIEPLWEEHKINP